MLRYKGGRLIQLQILICHPDLRRELAGCFGYKVGRFKSRIRAGRVYIAVVVRSLFVTWQSIDPSVSLTRFPHCADNDAKEYQHFFFFFTSKLIRGTSSNPRLIGKQIIVPPF